MRRREFLAGATGLAGLWLPCVASGARARAKPHRIGMLPDCEGAYCTYFHDAMREHGWREGRDFVVLQSGLRYGDSLDEAARRTVALQPDLIYTVGSHFVLAARRQTTRIPIVMWASGYPVEAGFARTLARPGMNVTGLSLYAGTEIFGKLLQLLRELDPGLGRVGVLWTYVPPAHPVGEVEPCYRELRSAGARLGIEITICELAAADRVDDALREMAAADPRAVFLTSGSGMWPVRERILQFALDRRWPTISDFRWLPDDALKPLMTYAPPAEVLIRQTVQYVIRILRDGANASELPIQQPAQFTLTVNAGTARALGLAVPPALLMRAHVADP